MLRIEIRGDQVLLDGYVNAVDRESRILPSPRGPFKEKIKPQTFQKALEKTDNVDLLFNHEENRKLGSTSQGNLQLYEDNIGLRAIATVTDSEVIQKAKDGKLTGWSFGFVDQSPHWEDGQDGIQRRFLENIDLLEVSILDKTPAYIATSIEARAEDMVIIENRSEEFRSMTQDKSKQDDPDDDGDSSTDNDDDGDGNSDLDNDGDGNKKKAKRSLENTIENHLNKPSEENRMVFLRGKEIEILKLRGGK